MRVTIDNRGGYYRWKIEVGTGRGSTFAEGKACTIDAARSCAYAVVAVFNRGVISNMPAPWISSWSHVDWKETDAAKAKANDDERRRAMSTTPPQMTGLVD